MVTFPHCARSRHLRGREHRDTVRTRAGACQSVVVVVAVITDELAVDDYFPKGFFEESNLASAFGMNLPDGKSAHPAGTRPTRSGCHLGLGDAHQPRKQLAGGQVSVAWQKGVQCAVCGD